MRKSTLFFSAVVLSAAAAQIFAADLPVTRVNLFSSGVGYFQRDGVVEGEDSIELTFSVDQINDILKSMVLQDFDGGTISAVNYPTQQPIEKALEAFAIKLGDKPTLGQLLDRCRGSRVELTGTTNLAGLILGVEERSVVVDEKSYKVEYLNLLTDDGIRRVDLDSVRDIKLTDPRLNEELTAALGVLARNLDSEKKTVLVRFKGSDKRNVRVGYMLEMPIWKTSYRLVLSDDRPPYLQGWANVENTTDEDWRNVRLSLVSGRPISFIQDLYTPIYIPRPEVVPELYTSLRPQEYAEGRIAGEGGRRGRGADREMMAKRAPSLAYEMDANAGVAMASPAVPQEMRLGETGAASIATSTDAGELFRYDIATPVTLERKKAAMLPIVGDEVEGEKLSIYNPAAHGKYPLNGLMLTNTSGLHLMQGPVTVFDDNTYAGDARLPDLKPGEKRLLSYALDLGVAVDIDRKSHPTQLTAVRIAKGTLIVINKSVDHRVYNLNNKLDKSRTVMIEQPMSDDWKLVEPAEPFEKADNMYRFKTIVTAKKTDAYPVRFEFIHSTHYGLSDMDLGQIRIYQRNAEITRSVRDALAEVIKLRSNLDDTRRQIQRKEQTIREIDSEQSRIRENMKALPRDSDVFSRYVRKLDDQENQIESLRSELEQLRQQADRQQKALEDYLLSLNVE
ncbi:MAG: hypothetical protein JSU68_06880 [Phycisphaerales bacterium]|nr:MAG: hypothetical protein JSU68_06880 [Phycisphaerales bacterium]